MMKALAAALSLAAMTACSSAGMDTAARPHPKTVSAKALPFAPPPPSIPEAVAVCAADVKQCANGSTVSRNTTLDCAFDRCPGENN
ncbi:MAG: hypothetical protein ACYCZA_01395 [Thiobacillus sp.]